MKILLMIAMIASLGMPALLDAAKHESRFACDRAALTPEKRKRHFDELSPALRSLRKSTHELADGHFEHRVRFTMLEHPSIARQEHGGVITARDEDERRRTERRRRFEPRRRRRGKTRKQPAAQAPPAHVAAHADFSSNGLDGMACARRF